MVGKPESTTETVPEIIARWRRERGNGEGPLSYRAFAEWLAAGIGDAVVSYQTIANWEMGVFLPNRVSLRFLQLSVAADDPRSQFAAEVLAALYAQEQPA